MKAFLFIVESLKGSGGISSYIAVTSGIEIVASSAHRAGRFERSNDISIKFVPVGDT